MGKKLDALIAYLEKDLEYTEERSTRGPNRKWWGGAAAGTGDALTSARRIRDGVTLFPLREYE